jgi:transposase
MGMKNLLLKTDVLEACFFQITLPGATDMEIVPVYVGLDYHSDTIRVCVMDEHGETLVNKSVANDPAVVVDLVRQHGGLVRGVSIEACCGAANFATALAEMTEWTVRMAHPLGVNRMKNGPDKTDHTDAWHLANLLRVGYLPNVWLADETTRQLRRLVRYRAGLVAQKKDIKLRILSLLREERIENTSGANTWAKPWMTWIETVKAGEQTRWVLDKELGRLEVVEKDLEEVDKRMDEATKDDPVVEKLQEQPGIGRVTAVTLRAVIGRFDRFRTGKQLSKYCGLSPCNASSGPNQSDAGLIDAGNDILRALLIQLAKRLPRQDPHWKELHTKLRITKGANVASAAIANRWLRKLFHEMVTKVKSETQKGMMMNVKVQAG